MAKVQKPSNKQLQAYAVARKYASNPAYRWSPASEGAAQVQAWMKGKGFSAAFEAQVVEHYYAQVGVR